LFHRNSRQKKEKDKNQVEEYHVGSVGQKEQLDVSAPMGNKILED
jgi:hypothetical protein